MQLQQSQCVLGAQQRLNTRGLRGVARPGRKVSAVVPLGSCA